MPYICVLEPCPEPNSLFESGKDWIDHMRNQHATSGWTCMDGSHETTFFFDTDSAFKNHMHQYHRGQFQDGDLDDLAATCHHRLPVNTLITECPFCPEGSSWELGAGEMINHFATHLLALAQISIAGHIDGDGGH